LATKERWTTTPAAHDFDAAADYLSLLFDDVTVRGVVRRLRAALMTTKKAKDLLRASRLGLLPDDDPELVRDLKKVKRGEKLSPVLLVRGGLGGDRPGGGEEAQPALRGGWRPEPPRRASGGGQPRRAEPRRDRRRTTRRDQRRPTDDR